MKWFCTLICFGIGFLLLRFGLENSNNSLENAPWPIFAMWGGALFVGVGVVFMAVIFAGWSQNSSNLSQSSSEELDESSEDGQAHDAIANIAEPNDGDLVPESDIALINPSDVTAEVPMVEDEEEDPEEKTKKTARNIALEKWKVVRVVIARVPVKQSEEWRALVVVRSLDGCVSQSLEICDTHKYYYNFFALWDGEEVEFVFEGENFETGEYSNAIPEDFLRVVMPTRLVEEATETVVDSDEVPPNQFSEIDK